MRKWTQGIKLTLSESIKVEVENAYRKEINDANPSSEPFTGQFSDDQQKIVDKRTTVEFDIQLEKSYEEAIKKAKFLVKLAIPKAFQEAKAKEQMQKLKAGIANRLLNSAMGGLGKLGK